MNIVEQGMATRLWTGYLGASLSCWKPLLPAAVVLLCAYVCGGTMASVTRETVNIVPLPVSIEQGDGVFLITPATRVIAEGGTASDASKLIDALAPATGYR
ncbi:MAG: hypothetical protein JW955_09835, partial [Sedimentisphaerales bacterium]|nr:hypothetical protein [Sedimentisphaerales bacterium]